MPKIPLINDYLPVLFILVSSLSVEMAIVALMVDIETLTRDNCWYAIAQKQKYYALTIRSYASHYSATAGALSFLNFGLCDFTRIKFTVWPLRRHCKLILSQSYVSRFEADKPLKWYLLIVDYWGLQPEGILFKIPDYIKLRVCE